MACTPCVGSMLASAATSPLNVSQAAAAPDPALLAAPLPLWPHGDEERRTRVIDAVFKATRSDPDAVAEHARFAQLASVTHARFAASFQRYAPPPVPAQQP